MATTILSLYHHYHQDRGDERLEMFKTLGRQFNIERILYPGCFVHVTPSFEFPVAVYVDMEKRAKQFFGSPELQELINERKSYAQAAQLHFYQQDYVQPLPESDKSFDLLISQYAGFISQHCKRYLRIGGLLVANNSHGDAGMASLDADYRLTGVMNRRSETFRYHDKDLDQYFVPKKDIPLTQEYLRQLQRGVAYQRSAFAYIFERIR